jgi:hypothetical protein
MLVVEGFHKFAGIPFGISRIFESLMPQQISANRRKNRSIQVLIGWGCQPLPGPPKTFYQGEKAGARQNNTLENLTI